MRSHCDSEEEYKKINGTRSRVRNPHGKKIIPTLTDFRISESPDERIRRILIIRIKDDIPQDLPDVELVTDLVSML